MPTSYKRIKDDHSIHGMVETVITKFPEEFAHINQNSIHLAWRLSKRSPYHARTRKITGEWLMFTNKKIVITFFLRSWKAHDKAWRMLLIYHELRHIIQHPKLEGEYVLKRHDVEDFGDIVEAYGPRWQKASKFLETMEKRK